MCYTVFMGKREFIKTAIEFVKKRGEEDLLDAIVEAVENPSFKDILRAMIDLSLYSERA